MCFTTVPSRCRRSSRLVNASCCAYVKRPRRVNELVVTSFLMWIRRRLSIDDATVLWYICLEMGSLASSSFCSCEITCASGAVHIRRCSLVSGPCMHSGQLWSGRQYCLFQYLSYTSLVICAGEIGSLCRVRWANSIVNSVHGMPLVDILCRWARYSVWLCCLHVFSCLLKEIGRSLHPMTRKWCLRWISCCISLV